MTYSLKMWGSGRFFSALRESTIRTRMAHDGVVVEGRVIGADHDAVRLGFQRRLFLHRLERVRAVLQRGHPRIRVADHRAAFDQQLQHIQGGRFAHVADIFLVRHPEQMNARAVQRLLRGIQRVGHALHHVGRHRRVDLPGQLDEPALEAGLARLPREIKRIDRDAVAAEARAGIERHEAERLRLGRVDHFPDVDAEVVRHQRNLVDEADVHRAEGVFQQLHHLRHARRADRHHLAPRSARTAPPPSRCWPARCRPQFSGCSPS